MLCFVMLFEYFQFGSYAMGKFGFGCRQRCLILLMFQGVYTASRALCRLRLLVLPLSRKGGLADATPAAEAEEAVGVPWIFGELT